MPNCELKWPSNKGIQRTALRAAAHKPLLPTVRASRAARGSVPRSRTADRWAGKDTRAWDDCIESARSKLFGWEP